MIVASSALIRAYCTASSPLRLWAIVNQPPSTSTLQSLEGVVLCPLPKLVVYGVLCETWGES